MSSNLFAKDKEKTDSNNTVNKITTSGKKYEDLEKDVGKEEGENRKESTQEREKQDIEDRKEEIEEELIEENQYLY